MTNILSDADHAELCDLAESAMVDTCTITRPAAAGEQGELNPTTLQYDDAAQPTDIYTGICEVDGQGGQASDRDAAAADWSQLPVFVKLPIRNADAGEVRRGDVVTINTCRRNEALVGHAVTVDGIQEGTWSTKRRLVCLEGV